MDILYLLIPLSILLVIIIAWLFLWSIKSGQYDDLDGPPYRLLMDDDRHDTINADEYARRADRSNQERSDDEKSADA